VCKAHRLLCHSTLGLRVIKKKKQKNTAVDIRRVSTRWSSRVSFSLKFRVSRDRIYATFGAEVKLRGGVRREGGRQVTSLR